jgi:hypothetical protein
MKIKHHAPDYAKNKTADVIPKGWAPADPNKQWELNLDATPEGNGNLPSASFLPQSGTTRAQPHKKINEDDH